MQSDATARFQISPACGFQSRPESHPPRRPGSEMPFPARAKGRAGRKSGAAVKTIPGLVGDLRVRDRLRRLWHSVFAVPAAKVDCSNHHPSSLTRPSLRRLGAPRSWNYSRACLSFSFGMRAAGRASSPSYRACDPQGRSLACCHRGICASLHIRWRKYWSCSSDQRRRR